MMDQTAGHIHQISLDLDGTGDCCGVVRKDWESALIALEKGSLFQPVEDTNGPYDVHLSVREGRLIIRIRNNDGVEMMALVLSMRPYKRIIQDYYIVVNSYEEARSEGKSHRLEAIDMGRRGLHNEGAELLQKRLADKVEIDLETARKLFTLICVLHAEKSWRW